MEILRVKGERFGKLNGTFELECGLNVVIGANQSGKSTLVSLILSLLYGLDRSRPFAPWGGGTFAGEIDVALASGKHYRVLRDFEKGVTAVTDLNGGRDATAELLSAVGSEPPEIGPRLTSVSRAAFLGSGVICQGAHFPGEAPERESLLRAIHTLVDTAGAVEETADEALGRLRAAIGKEADGSLRPGALTEQVESIDARVRELIGRLESLAAKRQELPAHLTRLGEIGRALPELERSQNLAQLRALLFRQRALTNGRERLRVLLDQQQKLTVEAAGLRAVDGLSTVQLAELEQQLSIYGAARAEAERLATSYRSLADEIDGLEEERTASYASLVEMTAEKREKFLQTVATLRLAKAAQEALVEKVRTEEETLAHKASELARFERLRTYFRGLSEDQIGVLDRDAAEEERAERDEEALRGEEAELRRTVAEINADREARGRTGRLLLYLGMTLLVLGLVSFLGGDRFGGIAGAGNGLFQGMAAAFLIVSVLLVGLGAWNLSSQGRKASAPLDGAKQQLLGVKRRRADAVKRRRDREQAIGGLVASLGLEEGASALRERYLQYLSLREVFEEFFHTKESLEQKGREIAELELQMESMLLGCGFLLHGEDLTDEVTERFSRQSADLTRLEERIGEAKPNREAILKELRAHEIARDEARMRIEEILAGVEGTGQGGDDLEERVEGFRRAVEAALRRQAIESKELPEVAGRTAELLGDLEPWLGRCSVSGALEALEDGSRACERAIEPLRGLVQEAAEETTWVETADYEASARRLAEKRIALEKEQYQVRDAVRALFEGLDAAPDLAAEIEGCEAEKARILRFHRALEVAAGRIDRIARTTHARWARKVNQTAGKVLTKLSGSFSGMHFNDDLSFALFSRSRGEPLSESEVRVALSQGARDLIYIAFRLAVCRFLSGLGEPLPLILDDALVTLDDEAHCGAMDLLREGADGWGQQVILLTCHESLYRLWREGAGKHATVNEILLREGGPRVRV